MYTDIENHDIEMLLPQKDSQKGTSQVHPCTTD